MTLPRSTYITAAGFEIHVTEWGNPQNPALVMWHGLARTGRDFDEVAEALSDTYFVICPDTLGRGLSSWAKDFTSDYSYANFGRITLDILAYYGIDTLRWVGTSMGGLVGVTLAANLLKKRITHLVINDVGPDIPATGTDRIVSYISTPPIYDTVGEMEAWLRTNYAPFGNNTDAFWRRMVDTSVRRTNDGRVTVHYDPSIVSQFTHHKSDLDVWDSYDLITAKTLLLRGATSDVLSVEVAGKMQLRGPKPELVTLDECGHAPTLTSEREITLLRSFLAS